MSFSKTFGKDSSRGVKLDVKPFRFGQLNPGAKGESGEGPTAFELKPLKDAQREINNENGIRTERKFERENSFSILPLVREHRGIKGQEERDLEDQIEREVRSRLNAALEQAKQEGYRVGHQEGYSKAYQEGMVLLEDKAEEFADMLSALKEQCHQVFIANKAEAYKMVKSLAQWVCLKEVEKDGYLERLLERLILEMNTKRNLVARVDQESFKRMPEVIAKVEAKLGTLANARIEVDLDQSRPGIALESENGIIDGSFEAQMASIEKIFESVRLDE